MALGIKEIRDRAVTLIEAATPDVETHIAYREAPYTGPLATVQPSPSPSENTRGFHCLCGDVLGPGAFAGPDIELVQRLDVDIRYDVGLFDDWFRDLHTIAASDKARLIHALEYTSGWSGLDCFGHVRFLSATPLTRSPQIERMYTRRLSFRVTYILLEA